MSTFTIEKNVPLPSHAKGAFRSALASMDVGDSFEVPADSKVVQLRTVAVTEGRLTGRKFSWRGRRVWRIK
jgi:hypothetical protein